VVQHSASVKRSWELEEGDEICPGRTVLRLLGGGHPYASKSGHSKASDDTKGSHSRG
jgi:hypothetical protein